MKYVVGDIHGGYLAFKEVLDKVDFDYINDELVCLGDVCDGWSGLGEIVELLNKINNLILIKGNHDDWALKYCDGKIQKGDYDCWLAHGGLVTKNWLDIDNNKEKFTKLFSSSKVYHIENNMIFAHAAIPLDLEFDKYPESFWFWDRGFIQDMYNHSLGRKSLKYKYIKNCPYDKVFVGHTPTKLNGYEPWEFMFLRNIDTGSAFDGYLTIMNIETDEYVKSTRLIDLYLNEKGRNK